jgi:hypothetical protein
LYGACLDSTRRRPDECRYARQKSPLFPIGGVFRIGASLLTVTFAPDVLDSKLKKNQSPVLFRLAGFRSHKLVGLLSLENNRESLPIPPVTKRTHATVISGTLFTWWGRPSFFVVCRLRRATKCYSVGQIPKSDKRRHNAT